MSLRANSVRFCQGSAMTARSPVSGKRPYRAGCFLTKTIPGYVCIASTSENDGIGGELNSG